MVSGEMKLRCSQCCQDNCAVVHRVLLAGWLAGIPVSGAGIATMKGSGEAEDTESSLLTGARRGTRVPWFPI